MSMDSTKELIFQNEIIAQMEEKGWIRGKTDGYDRERALYSQDALTFVQNHAAAGVGKVCQNLSYRYRASFPRCAGGAAEKADINATDVLSALTAPSAYYVMALKAITRVFPVPV